MDHTLAQTQASFNFFDWGAKKSRRRNSQEDSEESSEEEEDEDRRRRTTTRRSDSRQERLANDESGTCACWDSTEEFFESLDPVKWYEDCKMNDAEKKAQIAVDVLLTEHVKACILTDKYYTTTVTEILQLISPQPNALVHNGPRDRQHSLHFEQVVDLSEAQRACLGTFYNYLIDMITIVFVRIGALEKLQPQAHCAFEKMTQIFSYLMGLRLLILRRKGQLPMLRNVDTSAKFLLQHILPHDDGLLTTMASKHSTLQELNTRLKQTDIAKAKLQNERDALVAQMQIVKSEVNQAERAREQMLDIPFLLSFHDKRYHELLLQEGDTGGGKNRQVLSAVEALRVRR